MTPRSINIDWSHDWFHPQRNRNGNLEGYEDFIDRRWFDKARKDGDADSQSEPDESLIAAEVDWRAVVERIDPGDRRNEIRAEVAIRRFEDGWSLCDILRPRRGPGRPSYRELRRDHDVKNAWRWLTKNKPRLEQEARRQEFPKPTERIEAEPALDAVAVLRRKAEQRLRERAPDFCGPSIASSRRGGVPEAILRAANPYRVRINPRTGELVCVDPLGLR